MEPDRSVPGFQIRDSPWAGLPGRRQWRPKRSSDELRVAERLAGVCTSPQVCYLPLVQRDPQQLPPRGGTSRFQPERFVQRPRRTTLGTMGGGTGPAICLGCSDQARADGVPLNVAERRPEVSRGKRTGKEAILPQVSHPPPLRVPVLGIAAVHSPKQHGQAVVPLRNGDPVDMVGHQAVDQRSGLSFLRGCRRSG